MLATMKSGRSHLTKLQYDITAGNRANVLTMLNCCDAVVSAFVNCCAFYRTVQYDTSNGIMSTLLCCCALTCSRRRFSAVVPVLSAVLCVVVPVTNQMKSDGHVPCFALATGTLHTVILNNPNANTISTLQGFLKSETCFSGCT